MPMERLAVNHRRAAAAEGVVDAGAGVAVRLSFIVGPEQLDLAGHRR